MFQHRRFAALLLLLCCVAGCSPAAPQIIIVPTLAVLPSLTPLPEGTLAPTLTYTPRPSMTPTENLLETQVVQLNATLNAFLTQNAAQTDAAPSPLPVTNPVTATLAVRSGVEDVITSPTVTVRSSVEAVIPSATITNTVPPTDAGPQVTPVLAQAVYVTSTANLRDCASRECTAVLQIEPRNALLVTGTMEGEAINAGNSLWYRIDYLGQTLFVYSALVSVNPPPPPTLAPPTAVPPTAAPVLPAMATVPPQEAFMPPISLPQGGAGCPSTSATCGQLTCPQAYACLAAGNGRLDADDDGIPCESVCMSGD